MQELRLGDSRRSIVVVEMAVARQVQYGREILKRAPPINSRIAATTEARAIMTIQAMLLQLV